MLKDNNDNNLSSAEVAALWMTYMNNSLLLCTFKYFLAINKDQDIQAILEDGLKVFSERIVIITGFFNDANLPIPEGFTDKDVNVNAPRLFTDNFVIYFLAQMTRAGAGIYSTYLPLVSRPDIVDFFVKCIYRALDHSKWVTSMKLSKGIFVKPPLLGIPETISYVKNEDFLAGLLKGDRRSLHIKETTILFSNIQTNALGKTMVTGFSQVAESEQVKEYMNRGKKISSKHIEIFSGILKKDNISASTPHWNDMVVTDSTVAPFSDKLMMAIIMYANQGGIEFYGAGLALDVRRDIVAKFIRLITEVRKYAADGIEIMIKNGWLEQPPQAVIPSALTKT